MWRLLGKSAHLWPEWLYKIVSKIHSKIIKFNHSFLGEKIIGDHILLLETTGNKTNQVRKTPLTYANCENDYIVAASYSGNDKTCLLYTSPSPRDGLLSRMPSSA